MNIIRKMFIRIMGVVLIILLLIPFSLLINLEVSAVSNLEKIILAIAMFGIVSIMIMVTNVFVLRGFWENVHQLENEMREKIIANNIFIVEELERRNMEYDIVDFNIPEKDRELRSYTYYLAKKYIPIEDYKQSDFSNLEKVLLTNYNLADAYTTKPRKLIFNYKNSKTTEKISTFENRELLKMDPTKK